MNEENKLNEMNPESGAENNYNNAPQTNPMPESAPFVTPVQPVPVVEEPVATPVQTEPMVNEVKPSIVQEHVDVVTEQKKKRKGGMFLLVVIVLIIIAVIVFLPQISDYLKDII
jgi:hypothetical protein